MNLAAFQSFIWNRHAYSTSGHLKGMSEPVVPPVAAHCLAASAPYLLKTSGVAT